MRLELSAEIHETLKQLEEDLELLRQDGEDIVNGSSGSRDRRRDSIREGERSRVVVLDTEHVVHKHRTDNVEPNVNPSKAVVSPTLTVDCIIVSINYQSRKMKDHKLTDVARPSTPSVRLTAFVVASITNIINGMYIYIGKFKLIFKNGINVTVSIFRTCDK